jgi:hypothetical protein
MQTPAGAFNSQVNPDQISRDSFVSRLYSRVNNRGPFLYPESPYALGDISDMPSMSPIDFNTLFVAPPSASPTALSTAPIGSAAYPTFQSSVPDAAGTTLGPQGASVPSTSPAGLVTQFSNTSAYGLSGLADTPAPTLQAAAMTGQGAGPITYTTPWPTMTQPAPANNAAPAASAPDAMCQFAAWVQANPLLAGLGVYALYLALKRRRR